MQKVTIGAAIEASCERLDQASLYFGHGTDNPWDEAVHLVLGALKLPLDSSRELLEQVITREQGEVVESWLTLRIEQRLPLPYISGEAWFCLRPYFVNSQVLIPRSPIAELISQEFRPWLQSPPKRILDLCCGNGCIGIATALAFPEAEVILADISEAALQLAQRNIQRYQLAPRVSTVQSDLFGSVDPPFDLIISNPPYVDAGDMASLPPEYQHEPVLALASGDDGLTHPKQILQQAGLHLNAGGILVMEVGNSWQALEKAFPATPFCWLEFNQGGHGVLTLTAEQLPNAAAR